MDTAYEVIEESLIKRIYYSAREGMAIALYTLLSNRSDADVNRLINQVNRLFYYILFVCYYLMKIVYCFCNSYKFLS